MKDVWTLKESEIFDLLSREGFTYDYSLGAYLRREHGRAIQLDFRYKETSDEIDEILSGTWRDLVHLDRIDKC